MAVEPKITKLKPGEGARESGNNRKGRSTPEGTYRMSRNPCIISEGGTARVDPSCKSYLRSVEGRQTGEDMAKSLESQGLTEPDIFMSLVKALKNREIGWVGAYLDSKNPGRRYTDNEAKAIADKIMTKAKVGSHPGARLTKVSKEDREAAQASAGGGGDEGRKAMSVRQQRKLPGGRGPGTGVPSRKSKSQAQARKQTEEQEKYGIDPSSQVQKYMRMNGKEKERFLEDRMTQLSSSRASRKMTKDSGAIAPAKKGAPALSGSGAAGVRDILIKARGELNKIARLPDEKINQEDINKVLDSLAKGRYFDKNFSSILNKAKSGNVPINLLKDAVDQMVNKGVYEPKEAGKKTRTVAPYQPEEKVSRPEDEEDLDIEDLPEDEEPEFKLTPEQTDMLENGFYDAIDKVFSDLSTNPKIGGVISRDPKAASLFQKDPEGAVKEFVKKNPSLDKFFAKEAGKTIKEIKESQGIDSFDFDVEAQSVLDGILEPYLGRTVTADVMGNIPSAGKKEPAKEAGTEEPEQEGQAPEKEPEQEGQAPEKEPEQEGQAPAEEPVRSRPKPTDRGFVAPAQPRRKGGAPFTVNDAREVKEQVREIAKNSGGDLNQFIDELNQTDIFGSRGYETGGSDNPLENQPEDPYSRYRGTPAEPGQTGREPTEEEGQGDLFKQEARPEEKAATPATRQVPLRLGGDATQQKMKGQLATVKRREAKAVKDINAKASPGSKASKFEQDKETGEWTRKGRKASQGKQNELPLEKLPEWQPAPAQASKPAPAPTSKPAPAQASKPAPAQASKPAPAPTSKPAPAPTSKPAPAPAPKPAQASSGQGFGNTPKTPARKKTNSALDKLARFINDGIDRHQKANKKFLNRSEDGTEQMSYEEFSQAVRSMLR